MNVVEKASDILCVSYVRNRHVRRICTRSGLGLALTFVAIMMLLTSPKYFKENAIELLCYVLLLFYLPFTVVAAVFFAYNFAKNSPTWFEIKRIYHRHRKKKRMEQEILAFYQRR